jgi:plasmid stabilization system protein ParE
MKYQVELSRRAECDVEEAFLYLQKRAPLNAVRWRQGLEAKLRLLDQMPESFAYAPENQDTKIGVRQLLYGRYRILYTVRGSVVFILTVRHGARQFMTAEELENIS